MCFESFSFLSSIFALRWYMGLVDRKRGGCLKPSFSVCYNGKFHEVNVWICQKFSIKSMGNVGEQCGIRTRLFPGKIAPTVFSVKIESEVFSHGEGTKINLGFFILKFRLRIDLVKIHGFKAKFAISC